MAEYFREDGTIVPVTIVSAGPVTVTRVFEKSKDGYDSVQVGYGLQKKERITKSAAGAMKGGFYKTVKEFRLKPTDKVDAKEGAVIDVSVFSDGDKITVEQCFQGQGFPRGGETTRFPRRSAHARPKAFRTGTGIDRRRFAHPCSERNAHGGPNGLRSDYPKKSASGFY